MSATVDKYTYQEIIGLVIVANSPSATSIPHYALSLSNPGEYAIAMWSNEIMHCDIEDIGEDLAEDANNNDIDYPAYFFLMI